MQDVQVLRLEATQLVNQLPVEALQQAVDILKSLFYQEEPTETQEKPEPHPSEAILASSRSWSDIPDEEFNQLLKDIYEQRRMQNSQIGNPEPKSNGSTMAEMLERLRIINEEEPIELEIPLEGESNHSKPRFESKSLSESIDELQQLCIEEDYTFEIPPRRDRPNAFIEVLDEIDEYHELSV